MTRHCKICGKFLPNGRKTSMTCSWKCKRDYNKMRSEQFEGRKNVSLFGQVIGWFTK